MYIMSAIKSLNIDPLFYAYVASGIAGESLQLSVVGSLRTTA
jgi:hypothetical protein